MAIVKAVYLSLPQVMKWRKDWRCRVIGTVLELFNRYITGISNRLISLYH